MKVKLLLPFITGIVIAIALNVLIILFFNFSEPVTTIIGFGVCFVCVSIMVSLFNR